jgi:hypothetical protein
MSPGVARCESTERVLHAMAAYAVIVLSRLQLLASTTLGLSS